MPKNPFISTLVFTLLSFIPAAAGVFLLPLYLKQLSAESYAILSLVGVFAGIMALLGNLKLDAAMRTFYFDYKEDGPELKQYLQHIFSAALFISLGIYLLLLIVGPFLFQWDFKSNEVLFYPYGFYALSASFLSLAKTPYMIFLKNKVRLGEFAAYQLGEFGLIILFQAYLILGLGWGLEGALLGLLFAELLIFAVLISREFQLMIFAFNKEYLLPSLKYAVLLLPFVLMNALLVRGDRILFERFSELQEVGKYALLMTILGLSRLFFNALDNALRPFLFELFKEGITENKPKIRALYVFYISASCLCFSGLLFAGNYLFLLTDKPEYLEIIPYFSWAILALMPGMLTRIYNLQLVYVKKSQVISSYSFISFTVLILGFTYGVPPFGIWGALVAIGLSNFINMLMFRWLAQRYFGRKQAYIPGSMLLLTTAFLVFGVAILAQIKPAFVFNLEILQFPILLVCTLILSRKDLKQIFLMRKDESLN